jgi:hypothetical protein
LTGNPDCAKALTKVRCKSPSKELDEWDEKALADLSASQWIDFDEGKVVDDLLFLLEKRIAAEKEKAAQRFNCKIW